MNNVHLTSEQCTICTSNLESLTHWWNLTSSSSTALLLLLPVLSNSILSLSPSLSSGIPLSMTFIFTEPTISLCSTFPLADTCQNGWRVMETGTNNNNKYSTGNMGYEIPTNQEQFDVIRNMESSQKINKLVSSPKYPLPICIKGRVTLSFLYVKDKKYKLIGTKNRFCK